MSYDLAALRWRPDTGTGLFLLHTVFPPPIPMLLEPSSYAAYDIFADSYLTLALGGASVTPAISLTDTRRGTSPRPRPSLRHSRPSACNA